MLFVPFLAYMKEDKKEQKIIWKDITRITRWYWRLSREYSRWLWVTLFVFGVAAVLSQALVPLILKRILDIISSGQRDWSYSLQQQVVFLTSIVLVQNVLFRIGDLGLRKYQVPGRAKIVKFLFAAIQKQSYGFFANTFTGSLVSKAKRFEDGFSTLSDGVVFTLWWQSVILVSMLVTLAVIFWPLAVVFLLCIVILFSITIPAFRKTMEYDAREGEASSKLTGYFSDVMTNILNIKVFSAGSYEKKRFDAVVDERAQIEDASYRTSNKLIAMQAGVGEVLGVMMIVTALWLWSQERVTAGTILLVITFSQGLFHIIFPFTRSIARMLQAIANAKEMVDILEGEPTILDGLNAQKLRVTEGGVCFTDVRFSYDDGGEVFRGFSINIQAGEKIGIVGPSGGGKSTLTKLLLRFMDPVSGSICIDGQNIREVTQESLHRSIAYVPQDPILFHRTLRENIAYGRPDATEEEVFEAAKKAHAHEFIVSLEKGYDTLVGERGVKLSGGQRQRIAIARAILRNAPILVLDEATSALDTISELAIREAVDELIKDKTAIIIAHRLSTVEKMDRIIVLGKDGMISEEGSHQELVAQGGLYAELWSHQTGGFLPLDEDKEEESNKSEGG